MKCKSSFNVNHICVYCNSAVVIYDQNLFNLMSRSTLHKGDMSSNVFENFTTYEKNHISLQSEIKSFSKLKKEEGYNDFGLVIHWKSSNRWICEEMGKKRSHGWVNVLQKKHRATFTLQQSQRSLHDLPDNLFQVGLFLKQVIDHLQQSLWQQQ